MKRNIIGFGINGWYGEQGPEKMAPDIKKAAIKCLKYAFERDKFYYHVALVPMKIAANGSTPSGEIYYDPCYDFVMPDKFEYYVQEVVKAIEEFIDMEPKLVDWKVAIRNSSLAKTVVDTQTFIATIYINDRKITKIEREF